MTAQVYIHPARTNRADPNALLVCSQVGKTVYRAGYLPRALAGAVAPLIRVGQGGMGVVVETVTTGGTRTGLRIIGTVGREMFVESVPSNG